MNNKELINYLINSGTLKSPEIIDAFKKIDRGFFVLPQYRIHAYHNYPLPIGHDQTISQPQTVAFMLELLKPKKEERVLDVGAGSGWTTALLAHIVGPGGQVYATEIIPALIDFATNNFKNFNLPNINLQLATKTLGLPKEAPFDKILVSATTDNLPRTLIDQLKISGRMVIPIGQSIWQIDKKSEKDIQVTEYPGFLFVPLQT